MFRAISWLELVLRKEQRKTFTRLSFEAKSRALVFWLENASSNVSTRRRQRQLGRELRRMYQHVTNEPLPEDLLNLLERIDACAEGMAQTSDRDRAHRKN